MCLTLETLLVRETERRMFSHSSINSLLQQPDCRVPVSCTPTHFTPLLSLLTGLHLLSSPQAPTAGSFSFPCRLESTGDLSSSLTSDSKSTLWGHCHYWLPHDTSYIGIITVGPSSRVAVMIIIEPLHLKSASPSAFRYIISCW